MASRSRAPIVASSSLPIPKNRTPSPGLGPSSESVVSGEPATMSIAVAPIESRPATANAPYRARSGGSPSPIPRSAAGDQNQQPGAERRADADEQPLDQAARLDRRTDQEDRRYERHGDGEDGQQRPEQGAPEQHRDEAGREPDQEVDGQRLPAPVGDLPEPDLALGDRGGIRRALDRLDRPAADVVRHRNPVAVEKRRQQIGREDVAVHPGRVRGQPVAGEAVAEDPDREQVPLGRRALDRDQEIAAARRAIGTASSGRSPSSAERIVTPGQTPGSQESVLVMSPARSAAINAGEPASGRAAIVTPAWSRAEASCPGSMSAGASSARSSTRSQRSAGTRLPVTYRGGSVSGYSEVNSRLPWVMSR